MQTKRKIITAELEGRKLEGRINVSHQQKPYVSAMPDTDGMTLTRDEFEIHCFILDADSDGQPIIVKTFTGERALLDNLPLIEEQFRLKLVNRLTAAAIPPFPERLKNLGYE